jgi:diguanylate cyclase (GGDEF)-like protein
MIALAKCNQGGEDGRLAALRRYEVLDTAPEKAFDKITLLVKATLQMPMALVSLVDRDRQWFKSRQGVTAPETPRNISFCAHTIQDTRPFIVNDTHADPRFLNNPLVVGEPYIRFYIGVPLRSRDGYNVGALCSMDTKIRHLKPEQVQLLENLGSLVVDELELRVLASTDSLTGVASRRAFAEQAKREISRSKRYGKPLICFLIDVDRFKSINDLYGHGVGDLVLKQLARICVRELRNCDYIGRMGGEEFAVMLPETDFAAALEVAERLRSVIEKTAIDAFGAKISISVSIGVAGIDNPADDFDALLRKADSAMYDAKKDGRNRVCCYLGENVKPIGGAEACDAATDLKCCTAQ